MAGEKAKVIPLHPDSGRLGARGAQRSGSSRRHPSAGPTATGSEEQIDAVIREFDQRRAADSGPGDLVARIAGLADRGRIAVGYKADLNVIDADALRLHRPVVVSDLPAGGRRLDQTADGYVATVVAGEVIAENGVPTAARPGRLIRGRQPAPVG